MPLSNEKIRNRNLLADMYADPYFPRFLVDKIKSILLDLCQQIESERPEGDESLLVLTHAATERINTLADEFHENKSELETVAREAMAAEFEFIVHAYGFEDVDIEEMIEPREW